ncbi:hypothetical protein [Prosthecobacter sp.]
MLLELEAAQIRRMLREKKIQMALDHRMAEESQRLTPAQYLPQAGFG